MGMNLSKKYLIAYKLFFALLGFSAITSEIATISERGNFVPLNFFSYFTIESNILVVITLLLSAVAVAWGKNDKLDKLRSAATVYIVIVGIGFAVLLAGIEGMTLTAVPWNNTVLHYIVPLAMVVDFLIDRPGRKLSFRRSLVWLLFPVVYLAYSLVRGGLSGWYPYPFLDPATSGYAVIAVTAAGLLVLGVVLTWGVTRLSGASTRTRI